MSRVLHPRPLSAAAFAPFGMVLAPDAAERRSINKGTCVRFHAMAAVPALGAGAQAIVSLFRAQPIAPGFAITMMERHPLGAQAFWPLGGRDWLAAVAPDEGGTPGEPLLFRVPADLGVCYAPGIWHHPLMALGAEADFLVVDRDGPGDNLEEAEYGAPWPLDASAFEAAR